MLLLTMMQLLVMVRLKCVLMLRPCQISTMHRHMLLIEELQMRSFHSNIRVYLSRAFSERYGCMAGSHERFLLLDRWLAIAGNEDLTKPSFFD
jgi:hypothetical protein